MKVVIDDYRLEKMDVYTEPLEAKIRRQAAEITRLLAENAELKKGREAIRDNAFEAGMIRGHEDAWKLAHKIFKMDVSTIEEIFIETGVWNLGNVLEDCTYSEAAAKVAEWENAKEEICVGDVVEVNGLYAIVTYEYEEFASIVHADGQTYFGRKDVMTKTGRHIDVNAWLAQIGGER